jgi:hypothetical protein
VKETAARKIEQEQLNERLKTEEGLKRQQSILEHAEDIDELVEFLRNAGK